MSIHKTTPRLYVSRDLSSDGILSLDKDQSHYLIRVMRRKAGDAVIVFNGRDGEWQASIGDANKSSVRLDIEHRLRPQTEEPDIWLAFAPIKKARLDFLIEKATELGVAQLLPVMTRHTEVARINCERLQATAIEASEQCERLSVPAVQQLVNFDTLLEGWPQGRRLLYLDETGHGKTLSDITLHDTGNGFLVGPEGGFSPSELDALRELPFSCGVTLGPRVLRAETAALSALACWQSIFGDTCVKRLR